MEVVCKHLVCGENSRARPNFRPVKLGEAWTDGAGRWVAFPVRRNPKGPHSDDLEGGQLGPAGFITVDPRFSEWRGSGSADDRRPRMERFLSRPLLPGEVDDWLVCSYFCSRCRRKTHWAGADRDELIAWFELALKIGARQVPLPYLYG